jgi:hypothetical protein
MIPFHLAMLLAMLQGPTAPTLGPPMEILAGGESIAAITGHAAPLVYDFNHDGNKDLIVGEYGSGEDKGRARIYLNQGSNAKPSFTEFKYLESADGYAKVPSS